jgi:hypothetical protein
MTFRHVEPEQDGHTYSRRRNGHDGKWPISTIKFAQEWPPQPAHRKG